ncbi:ABC transporter ATP-binding protein [Janthinobacterium lividum]|uniref:ABC transporter ATP-binding protein n=1 Tax=Janthinobacterium lividum TaxID=29581 RepID=UPI000DFD0CAD|nr:ABC transporter ATP-binding protein [Janthinobacterium lividum]MBR7637143.1 ABC transporter ATP-binding protein [Janthinobacterium lividum]MCC7717082.1 ABC transporter ATP-binding protein [Janthinobacterium lividum]WQE27693.1 ABC transporter ATP-binding protein [Janthinobacterium lividum]STQ98608.1 Aliphatic sulfonates import ATP-binding protein SsuB [Janthinobacterium lividum]
MASTLQPLHEAPPGPQLRLVPETAQPRLELRGLTRDFTLNARPVRVVDNLSLSIAKGEFVSLIGPSGSGKSTILNMLSGVLERTAGDVLVDGVSLSSSDMMRELGYVFQSDNCYPWRSVADNIGLGLELAGIPKPERRRRVAEAIERIGLQGFERAFPKMLSGGMRQRVSLMRTLIMRPSILLMDEPFGALDTHTKFEMHKLLLELWQAEQQTVVFITHDLGEAITLSDRIVVLSARPGRIKEIFDVRLPRPRDALSVRELPEYSALFARIWHSLGEEFNKGEAT